MTQEEHILFEIKEFKIELQESIDRTRRLERFIREKETELYYHRMKSGKHSLFRSIQNSGFSSVENCRKICEIVKNWIPPALDGNGEYSDAWNDYREEILRNLT